MAFHSWPLGHWPKALACGAAAVLAAATGRAVTVPTAVRGARAVLLRVDRAPFELTLHKRDLNIYEGEDELRALLHDPLRRLVAEIAIPDGGKPRGTPGDLQSETVRLADAAPGVYRLQVTGNDLVFGLETSAEGCVLEGDVMLNDPRLAGTIVFAPPSESFRITARALHDPGRQQMALRDQTGALVHTFDLAKTGENVVLELPAMARSGVWRFDVGRMNVVIAFSRPVLWAAAESAWFDAARSRWLLQPFRQARYLQPGQTLTVPFDLTNDSPTAMSLTLQIQAPPGLALTLPDAPATLAAGETRTVQVQAELSERAPPGAVYDALLLAGSRDSNGVSAAAGLQIRAGQAPRGPLELPIVLRRYEHENWQFGYAPEFAANEVYFDHGNRPYMRHRNAGMYASNGIQVLEDGAWVRREFLAAIQAVEPTCRGGYYGGGGFLGAKVAFDSEGGAYTLLRAVVEGGRRSILVFTPDAGRTFQAYPIGGTAFDIEPFTGHNRLDGPPPILLYTFRQDHPARFAGYHDLHLLPIRRDASRLILGEPVPVAVDCLGSCQHSGGPASTATRDGKTHIVWGEIADDDAPGVPTFTATYDHALGTVSPKVLLGHGPPVNDVHNVPAITMDREGYLHVLIGAHGQAFQYARSNQPNSTTGGWTAAVPVLQTGYRDPAKGDGEEGRQTYISLVCDPQDALHIAFRQWRRGVDARHGGRNYAALSVQTMPKGGPWGPAVPLVVPPVDGYSIYYHKLTIDRIGRLFLSYSYWTADVTYQADFRERYHHPAIVMSADAGRSWRLAATTDFVSGGR